MYANTENFTFLPEISRLVPITLLLCFLDDDELKAAYVVQTWIPAGLIAGIELCLRKCTSMPDLFSRNIRTQLEYFSSIVGE